MKKIKTSALIGLGALGILFGRKMPGVQVIADADRIARYSASPVVCNGEACHFDYLTPAEGKPSPAPEQGEKSGEGTNKPHRRWHHRGRRRPGGGANGGGSAPTPPAAN